jgi:outer membrane protein assembly factor BamA
LRTLLPATALLLLLCFPAKAQQRLTLVIKGKTAADTEQLSLLKKKITYKKEFSDSLSLRKERDRFLLRLYDLGYLAASMDSTVKDSLTHTSFLSIGKPYKWIRLSPGNVDEGILSETNFRERLYSNRPVYFRNIRKLQERILDYCENNGYPFAEVRLDSVTLREGEISARLWLSKNTQVRVDSITVKGKATISPVYLHSYLGIKPGNLYNESLVREISNRIRELPFLNELKPFEISFSDKKARVYLYLENKRASQFDFIAGFLPDNQNTGKLQFSGEAHLKLQNSFGRGEVFELNWKSPLPLTQDLRVNVMYPFLFSSPFGIDAAFSLYKRDTTYVEIVQNLGLQYILTRGNYFKVFIVDKQSNLLDSRKYADVTERLEHLDVSSFSYGLAFRSEKLDYRINPREGYSLLLSGSIGTRRIRKNSRLREEVYEGLRLSSTVYSSEYRADYYIPLRSRSVIYAGIKGALLMSPDLLTNELFRIGGLRTLRGFDEETILASWYTIANLEYRFILEQNSYLFAFYNAAYLENRSGNQFRADTPYGFGAGIAFETRLGIFSFTYALGKQLNNPLYLRSGKLHFGIISYF